MVDNAPIRALCDDSLTYEVGRINSFRSSEAKDQLRTELASRLPKDRPRSPGLNRDDGGSAMEDEQRNIITHDADLS